MTFDMDIYKKAVTIVTKGIKFIGDNLGKILIVSGAGATLKGAKMIPREIEKHKTKYEYRDWIIYKKGKYIYAEKDNNKLKVEDCEYRKIEKIIDKL